MGKKKKKIIQRIVGLFMTAVLMAGRIPVDTSAAGNSMEEVRLIDNAEENEEADGTKSNSIEQEEVDRKEECDEISSAKECSREYVSENRTETERLEQPLNQITGSIELFYGEELDISSYAEENLQQAGFVYSDQLEITSQNTDKLKVNGCLVRAVGVTDEEPIMLKVRYPATDLLLESEEVELPVIIRQVEPKVMMRLQQNTSWQEKQNIYIHEELALHASIMDEGADYEELMMQDANLRIQYRIIHDESGSSKEYIKALGQHRQPKERTLDEVINVGWQHFPRLHKGEKYRMEMAVIYTGTDCPYKLPPKQSCELTLQAANAYLKTDRIILEADYRDTVGQQLSIPFNLMNRRLGLDSVVEEQQELELIKYGVKSSDPMIGSVNETMEYPADTTPSIPVMINGAGETSVQIYATQSPTYDIEDLSVKIAVNNSSMKEDDYCFEYVEDGITKKLSFEEWKYFLEERRHWLNGPVSVALTKEGQKYYDTIGYQNETAAVEKKDKGSISLGEDRILPMSDYSLWMEQEERNASTRGIDAEPCFQLGIDQESPLLTEVRDNSNIRYSMTSDDKIWYLGNTYEVCGVYEDEASGIEKIEYTTDCGKHWRILDSKEENDNHVRKFTLCLDNGTYTGIAIRAVDAAGNVSKEYRLTNKEDDYVKLIVDTRIPEVDIQVKKNTQNHPMQGTQDWTNCALSYQTLERQDNPRIYKTYYQYVPIQQVCMREQKGENPYQEEEWQELSQEGFTIGAVDDSQEPVNRNGVYYFKMVSMCGLESEVVAKEIKLQQTFPDIMDAVIANDRGGKWYHAGTPLPTVTFPYEDYLEGCVTDEEYQAPITIHRILSSDAGEEERSVTVGFTSREAYEAYCIDHEGYTKAAYDNKVKELAVSFDQKSDDKYMLSYWIEDAAGNRSGTVTHPFYIDTTAPDSLQVWLDDREYMTGMSENIIYDTFSQTAIQGKAAAQDNLSGIRSVRILKAKRFGEWKENSELEAGESFVISPCTRCFLYIVAEDEAGNQAYAWTNGIVVDDKAPVGLNERELVMKPAGANANGFYKEDITVDIAVKDMPGKDDFAALDTVSCVIASEGKEESRVLYHAVSSGMSEEELSKSGTFQTKVQLEAEQYEGNEAYIEVTAKDRAGNVTTSTQLMKIDVTSPEVEITFDHTDAEGGSLYKEERTATIHIYERNFDEKLVDIEVTRNGEQCLSAPLVWECNGSEYCASIPFSQDGDYTLTVKCKDMADNESEVVTAQPFTIDRTEPIIEINYEGEEAYKENYFKAARTAVISITEHNFDVQSFVVETSQNYVMDGWSHEGDKHQTRLYFTQDDHYLWSCRYADLAGNEAPAMQLQDFYIDTIAPCITIAGVADNSANSGEIIPVISVQEEHYNAEEVQIILESGQGEVIDIKPEIYPLEGGFSYTLEDVNDQLDNIYYLTVRCLDMAGNGAELTYRFSLNRNGSAYDIRQAKTAVSKIYYRSCDLSDLQIVEMNVDQVEKFSLYVLHNGVLLPAIQVDDRTEADSDSVCYKVNRQGDDRTGYTYTYTLFKESFGKEGIYNIAFYSKDAAGNEVNNTLESKDAELRFIVDNTPPKAVFDGVEAGGVYDMQEKKVNVMFTDNCKLEEAYVYLINDKGKTLGSWNYMESAKEEEAMEIIIPEYSGEQMLGYKAVDAAGNELTVQGDSVEIPLNFVITTNPWIRLTRTGNVLGIAACVVVIFGCTGGTMIALSNRKRRIKE